LPLLINIIKLHPQELLIKHPLLIEIKNHTQELAQDQLNKFILIDLNKTIMIIMKDDKLYSKIQEIL
jgi:hypothetical protein